MAAGEGSEAVQVDALGEAQREQQIFQRLGARRKLLLFDGAVALPLHPAQPALR